MKRLPKPNLDKPALRGYLHQAAFYSAIGAGAMLIAMADSSISRVASSIYIATLVGLFGISALYHRPRWNYDVRQWLRRFDHASIFFLIAGSATPVFLLGMSRQSGMHLFWIMWTGAFLGAMKCFFWTRAPRFLNVILYVSLGWLFVPYLGEIGHAIGFYGTTYLVIGGIIYSLGALVYAFKRPDPYPKIFGYHEIFHAMVIVASVLHFVVIYHLVRAS